MGRWATSALSALLPSPICSILPLAGGSPSVFRADSPASRYRDAHGAARSSRARRSGATGRSVQPLRIALPRGATPPSSRRATQTSSKRWRRTSRRALGRPCPRLHYGRFDARRCGRADRGRGAREDPRLCTERRHSRVWALPADPARSAPARRPRADADGARRRSAPSRARAAADLARAHGAVVALTDAGITRPFMNHVAYLTAKGALTTGLRALAVELAPEVRVNCRSRHRRRSGSRRRSPGARTAWPRVRRSAASGPRTRSSTLSRPARRHLVHRRNLGWALAR